MDETAAESSLPKDHIFDPERELSWMDYEGLLDMEVEIVADLGQTTLSLEELLKLA